MDIGSNFDVVNRQESFTMQFSSNVQGWYKGKCP